MTFDIQIGQLIVNKNASPGDQFEVDWDIETPDGDEPFRMMSNTGADSFFNLNKETEFLYSRITYHKICVITPELVDFVNRINADNYEGYHYDRIIWFKYWIPLAFETFRGRARIATY